MKRASQFGVATAATLFMCLPAISKTTPPKELCERRGGKWDGTEQQCIMPYKPSPNKPPVLTSGTGTRYEVQTKFKGEKWTVKP